jgi:hypothetical protein
MLDMEPRSGVDTRDAEFVPKDVKRPAMELH